MIYFLLAVVSATISFYLLLDRLNKDLKLNPRKRYDRSDYIDNALWLGFISLMLGALFPVGLPLLIVYLIQSKNNKFN